MIKQIVTAIKLYLNFQKTHKELSKLSSRELEDIGLNRTMITRVSMEHARKITS